MRAGKSQPDRKLLLEFEKKRLRLPLWTPKEISRLIEAVQKFGKNYKKISKTVKTRNVIQCRGKVVCMIKEIASDPKHKNAKHAKVLKKIHVNAKYYWTEQEKKIFNKALQKHGKDYQKIKKYFPALTMNVIRAHVNTLEKIIKRDKNHPDSHLKK